MLLPLKPVLSLFPNKEKLIDSVHDVIASIPGECHE